MDEPSATRVGAPPDAAERGDSERREATKAYSFSVRMSTTHSAKFLTGLLVETLKQRGVVVESIRARFDTQPLAQYDRTRKG